MKIIPDSIFMKRNTVVAWPPAFSIETDILSGTIRQGDTIITKNNQCQGKDQEYLLVGVISSIKLNNYHKPVLSAKTGDSVCLIISPVGEPLTLGNEFDQTNTLLSGGQPRGRGVELWP